MLAVASNPFISGIWTSIRITSKCRRGMRAYRLDSIRGEGDACAPSFRGAAWPSLWLTTLSSASRMLRIRLCLASWNAGWAASAFRPEPRSARPMATVNSASVTGFVMYCSIPSRRHSAASESRFDEPSIMTIAGACGSLFAPRATAKPSNPGICASTRRISKRAF